MFDPEGCKNYAAKLTKNLDERLAKEASSPSKLGEER
jgi:hypothetical protein